MSGKVRGFLEAQLKALQPQGDGAALANPSDAAMIETPGGIDLNANNVNWNIRKDGKGVEMNVDPAMIERIKREGIDSLSPVIFRITPVTSIWRLAGLQAPAQAERLAGV